MYVMTGGLDHFEEKLAKIVQISLLIWIRHLAKKSKDRSQENALFTT
jgi:hypothetical protein